MLVVGHYGPLVAVFVHSHHTETCSSGLSCASRVICRHQRRLHDGGRSDERGEPTSHSFRLRLRSGGLGDRAVPLTYCQSTRAEASYSARPARQKRKKEAVGHPGLEAVVRRGTGAKASGVQSVPLAAGSQREEDRFGTHPVRHARPTATERCGFRCTGKNGSIKVHNSSVSPKQPPVLAMRLACGRRRNFFLAGEVFTHLYRLSPLHYSDRHSARLYSIWKQERVGKQ